MARLLFVVALLLTACASAPAERTTSFVPAVSSTQGPRGVGGIALRTVTLDNGLVMDVPASWSISGSDWINRGTQRQFVGANGDIASLPLVGGPGGDIDAAALPPGRFVFEVETFCRLSCSGPTDETPLPIDWAGAAPIFASQAMGAGHHQLGVALRWFNIPYWFVARWADDDPSDISLLPAIVRSVRPAKPVPTSGEYNGWDAIGPITSLPIGSVRFEALPADAIVQQPVRIYDAVPFFAVRGKQNVYAFVSRPLRDERCAIYYDPPSDHFVCTIDARTYEWTRFGNYLGPEAYQPGNNLTQHPVIERDGTVWVQYTRDFVQGPSVADEAAER